MARFHAHAEPKKAFQRASNVHLIKSDGQMEKASNPVSAAGIFHLGSRFLKTLSRVRRWIFADIPHVLASEQVSQPRLSWHLEAGLFFVVWGPSCARKAV